MNTKNLKPWAMACALCLPGLSLAGTDSTEVSMSLDIESVAQLTVTGDDLQWSIVAGSSAGEGFEIAQANLVQYLQFTSILDSTSSPRQITVDVSPSSEPLPPGLTLNIVPGSFNGAGSNGFNATPGTGAVLVAGNIFGSPLMATNIFTGWTGNGATSGLELNYELQLNPVTFYAMEAGEYSGLELVYTISESE